MYENGTQRLSEGTYSYTYSYTPIGETGTVPGPEQDREESGKEICVYE